MSENIEVKVYDQRLLFDRGVSVKDIFVQMGLLNKNVIAAKTNTGTKLDLSATVIDNTELEPVMIDSRDGEEILRHSVAHILAQAVMHLFPGVRFAIGPAIENGFYYDFDLDHSFVPEDLVSISQEMNKIIEADYVFEKKEITKEEAIKYFKEREEIYKVEILQELPEDTVALYTQGDFTDLCRGPHLPSTGYAKHFKLLSVAGAYWRGSEKNKMLQRIYGAAFATKRALKEHIGFLEEAKQRDHRKLGKELDLFSINENVGPGLILWHPKGAMVRKIVEDFWRDEHIKRGYGFVRSPHIARVEVWQTSGHWDFYRENMFSPIEVDKGSYMIKPMNCPFHIMVYKTKTRSYRDLPIRYAELGTVYRYEKSGVLHGLLRVRGFTQDDAHLFVTDDQLEDEIINVLDFTKFMIESFGFTKYNIYLSTRPEKYVGTLDKWEIATEALKKAVEKLGFAYKVDPGEGVFYGPKIDVKLVDALGREWQGPTVQVDFNLPERFDVSYIGPDGKEHQPIMLHRVVLGSMERFFGTLIEHYAGAFPVWLAPVQIKIVAISDAHNNYAKKVYNALVDRKIRVELDNRNEKMNAKIRDAEKEKVPYILVIGDKEMESGSVSVRKRKKGNLGAVKLEEFIERIEQEIKEKTID